VGWQRFVGSVNCRLDELSPKIITRVSSSVGYSVRQCNASVAKEPVVMEAFLQHFVGSINYHGSLVAVYGQWQYNACLSGNDVSALNFKGSLMATYEHWQCKGYVGSDGLSARSIVRALLPESPAGAAHYLQQSHRTYLQQSHRTVPRLHIPVYCCGSREMVLQSSFASSFDTETTQHLCTYF